jgi:acetyltransferase
MAFVAVENPGHPEARTLGVVRAVADPDNVEAEFAILTRSDLHDKGLGTLLMTKMLAYLRTRATSRVTAYVLNDNHAMHVFIREHGFEVQRGCNEPGVTHYALELGPAAGRGATAIDVDNQAVLPETSASSMSK